MATLNPVRLTMTELMADTMNGYVENIRKSLSTYGLPINNEKITDYNVLQKAIESKQKEIAKLLLQAGCKINDSAGNRVVDLSTPLYLAVEQHDDEIVMLLLEKGAAVDVINFWMQETPMHFAARNRLQNLLWMLLDFSTNVNLSDKSGQTVLGIILQQNVYENRCEETVSPDIVRKLIGKGASINCQGRMQQTTLHLAARMKQKNILPILLEASRNVDLNKCDFLDNTVLHSLLSTCHANADCSNEKENLKIVESLLQRGCNLNAKNRSDETPFHLAAQNRHFKVLSYLLKYRIHMNNVNECDKNSETILHRLLKHLTNLADNLFNELIELVIVLVSKGAKVNISSKSGETALHLAAQSNLDVLSALLKSSNDVSVGDSQGNTILHILVSSSDPNIQLIQQLLQKGLRVDIANLSGVTPIDLAARGKNLKVLSRLLISLSSKSENEELLQTLLLPSSLVDSYITISIYQCTMLLHLILGIMMDNVQQFDNETSCQIVKILLLNGALVDAKNASDYMSLHSVVQIKDPELIKTFLECVTKENISNEAPKSLINFLSKFDSAAIIKSKNEIIELSKLLLDNGAAVEESNCDCNTVFDLDIHCEELLKLLLEHVKDVKSFRNNKGDSVLHLAQIFDPCLDVVRLLISKGAPPDAQNDKGQTPLHIAAGKHKLDTIEHLLQHASDVNIRDQEGNGILHSLLLVQEYWIRRPGDRLETTVQALLDKGYTLDLPNALGRTELHLACERQDRGTQRLLLQRGSSITSRDNEGNGVLHCLGQASIFEDAEAEAETTRFYLARGCGLEARNEKGETPLHRAAANNRLGVVRALIEGGADVNSVTPECFSRPLHLAADRDSVDVVEILLESGAHVNAHQSDGRTALHMACAVKFYSMQSAKTLVRLGADPEVRDELGQSPLHYACRHENYQAVNELLAEGADLNARDRAGRLPLEFCSAKSLASASQVDEVVEHVVRLKIADLRVDGVNETLLKAFYDPATLEEGSETMLELKDEINEMRDTPIDRHTSLYHILHMSLDKLVVCNSNPTFRETLKSSDFDTKFPHYGDLIRARQRSAEARGQLLSNAKHALARLTAARIDALPELCSRKILAALNNESLWNLTEAGSSSVGNRKRKINSTEAHASRPAKLSR